MVAPYNSAPTLYKNLLIVGTNGSPGGVRAFDARTGTKVWDFHSVPKAGEPASRHVEERKLEGSAQHLQLGVLADAGSPRAASSTSPSKRPGPSDYWGADRPGDNLYGNSLLALDAATGKLKWHFQTVHHDLWDYDLPSPPSLLDVTIGGQVVPVLAQTSKTGYMYVLNRVTGKPVFGMDERHVAQERRAERRELAHSTDSGQATAARARRLQARRHRHRVGHHGRTRGVLPCADGAQRRVLQRRPVHAVRVPRSRRAASLDDPLPGLDRRRQLGRHGGRPRPAAAWTCVRARATPTGRCSRSPIRATSRSTASSSCRTTAWSAPASSGPISGFAHRQHHVERRASRAPGQRDRRHLPHHARSGRGDDLRARAAHRQADAALSVGARRLQGQGQQHHALPRHRHRHRRACWRCS